MVQSTGKYVRNLIFTTQNIVNCPVIEDAGSHRLVTGVTVKCPVTGGTGNCQATGEEQLAGMSTTAAEVVPCTHMTTPVPTMIHAVSTIHPHHLVRACTTGVEQVTLRSPRSLESRCIIAHSSSC